MNMNMDDEDWNKYHFVQGGFVSGLVTTRQAGLDWEVESGAARLRWSEGVGLQGETLKQTSDQYSTQPKP